jgi:hypothetical protein
MAAEHETSARPAPADAALAPARPAMLAHAGNRATVRLLSARPASGAIGREVDRVARSVGAEGGELDAGTEAAVERTRSRGRPLEPDVRARLEHGFGADLGAVRVHADGEADTLSRTVQAAAFASGNHVFFSAGAYAPGTPAGDELLAHEVAHAVEGDDEVRRVYAGLEYTEGIPTALERHPNAGPVGTPRAGGARTIDHQPLSFFVVPRAQLGPPDAGDRQVFRSGQVELTNDVQSAEWKVLGHIGPDVTAEARLASLTIDIQRVFALRAEMAGLVASVAVGPDEALLVVPRDVAALPAAPVERLFRYRPGPTSEGKAQITVQFTSKDDIRRIAEVNASRYLKGSKTPADAEPARAVGKPGFKASAKDVFRTSSVSTAHRNVLAGLVAASAEITDGGEVVLTAADVGLIKLMVLNDALATTMTRHAAVIGQAQEKNLQRFFPRAHRPTYVRALTEADLSPVAFGRLDTALQFRAAESAELMWNHIDASTLRFEETVRDRLAAAGGDTEHGTVKPLTDARGRVQQRQALTDEQALVVKRAILGDRGAELATYFRRAAGAYTDPTNAGHRRGGGHMNVLGSTGEGYAPLAGVDAKGGVYELRDAEVPVSAGSQERLLAALRTLLKVPST